MTEQQLARTDSDHAALMDGVYASQKYIYDLTRKYYLLGRDRLIEDLAPPPGGTVLELGCGTGRNMLVAARRWPEECFVGLDISEEMLGVARAGIERRGLGDRITVTHGDATNPQLSHLLPDGGFDRVFLSFCLSMIPDWKAVIVASINLLAEHGELHIVDFGPGAGLPRWFNKMLRAWLAKFHVEIREDLPEVAGRYHGHNGITVASKPLYRGYSTYVVCRRSE